MSKHSKLYAKIKAERKDVRFRDLITLAKAFGFELVHTKGSHLFFKHIQIPTAFLNFQNHKGKAKPYQVDQFISMVESHNLSLED